MDIQLVYIILGSVITVLGGTIASLVVWIVKNHYKTKERVNSLEQQLSYFRAENNKQIEEQKIQLEKHDSEITKIKEDQKQDKEIIIVLYKEICHLRTLLKNDQVTRATLAK
jgi:hypothetical protein